MKYLPSLALLAALCACSSDPHPYQAPGAKSSPSSKIKGMANALPTVEVGNHGGFAGGGGVVLLDPSGGAAGMGGGEAGQGGPTGGAAGQGSSGEAGQGGGTAGASGAAGQSAPDSGVSTDSGSGPRFVVNGDGTVLDNSSNLTWQQDPAKFTSRDSSGILRTSFTATYDEANTYCSSLNLAGAGWRLPTLPEIMAILDSSFEPALDPAVFTPPHLQGSSGCISNGVPGCYFTTTTACGTNGYRTVSMSYEQMAGVNGGQPYVTAACVTDYTAKAMVRCVR